jgi:hypothetical protein
MIFSRLGFFAFAAALTLSPVAMAQDYASACNARGKASPASCACQAKLANASLNRQERGLAIIAMQGDQEALKAEMARMGSAKAKSFVGKMQSLGKRSQQSCG